MRIPSSHLIAKRRLPHRAVATVLLLSGLGLIGQAHAEADSTMATGTPPACPPRAAPLNSGAPDAKTNRPPSLASGFMKKRWNMIDTNKDGIISKEEYLKEAADRFDATDANHDGKLTPDEVKAFFDKIDAERAKAEAFKKKCAGDVAPRP